MSERKKTFWLMAALVAIFMYVGNLIAGEQGMMTALLMAGGINFVSYFFSDKMVLSHYKATAVSQKNAPKLYEIVQRLAKNAALPMPKIYIIPEETPNAFATGRNPSHAAVAVTQGLLNLMTDEEVEGVLAHEMSHVRHYDILIGTVAAIFAGAIGMLGNIAGYGQYSSGRQGRNSAGILAIVVMPIAAVIVQMAISRSREYKADEGAALLTDHPEWLIAALQKLDNYAKSLPMKRASLQTAHLFIVNPMCGISGSLAGLFSTHPNTKDRIERLSKIKISRK
ncbi:MAG: zinc metalloprotease HtpX [Alphaproteobacteria bacterium]|nr:zinc metalloprotease HtpX [Alphaproteobacteria bacterium]